MKNQYHEAVGAFIARKGPRLVAGASYETVGGLIFVVLSDGALQAHENLRRWPILVLRGGLGGPRPGKTFELWEMSNYHQSAKRIS